MLIELATGSYPYGEAGKEIGTLTPLELAQCIVHEAPPKLSAEHFRPDLVDLVARCLMPQPEHRPTPDGLMEHPYFRAYAAIGDADPDLIAWISGVIAERRTRHAAAAAVAAAAAAAASQFSPPPGSSPEPGSAFMYM